ncbi:MAG: hypothetical protein KIG95_11930 [Comamonas sp.]|nr:hypothetical protein [Comamonas sp.]
MSAIQPKPTAAAQAVAATAPDGATHKGGMLKKDGTPRRVPVREKGTPISLTMPQALLEAVDRAAEESGLSRASYIKSALAIATKWGS